MNTRTEVAGFTATPGKSWRRSSVVLPDYTFMLKEATSDVSVGEDPIHPSISMVQKTPSDDSFILVTHKPLVNQSVLIIFPRGSPRVCVCRHVHAFV